MKLTFFVRPTFIATICVFVLIGCNSASDNSLSVSVKGDEYVKNELDKNSLSSLRPKTYDFQKIQPGIKYFLNEQDWNGKTPDELAKEVKEKNIFAKSSGLNCVGQDRLLFSDNITWESADKTYKNFVQSNKDHKWLFVFKQAASSYILTNLGLLADNSPKAKERIEFYFNEYSQSRGEYEAPISYFCLKQLRGYWPESKIEESIGLVKQSHQIFNGKLRGARTIAGSLQKTSKNNLRLSAISADRDVFIKKLDDEF